MPVADGACDRNLKARTYTPTDAGVTPTLQEGDFERHQNWQPSLHMALAGTAAPGDFI